MIALSIQNPWAYAIMELGKDIENRTWPLPKNIIGQRILIHVGKKYDQEGHIWIENNFNTTIPKDELVKQLSGIVGSVRIDGCVQESDSLWFFGPYGFVLSEPVGIEFKPLSGQLGFFKVSDDFGTK